MIDVGSDTSGIKRWLDETGSPQVAFLQALIDLRKEPRWLPEYASAAQLRAEMIGRLRVAAMMYSDGIVSEALTALLIGQNSTLGKAEGWLRPFLPGPLEGTSETIRPLTKEVLEEVRQAFAADELNASSFLDMVNFAYVSGDVAEVASLAADALKRLDHLVNTDGNDRTSFQALAALSIIASGARNKDLAEALRVLSRVKRRHGLFRDDPENEVRIVLIAGAAFEDCTLWASFVCEWITEICLTLETADRASNLIAILRRLRQLEPALLRYLSQSEAALSALESRS
jgi:hypothetical protein